MTQPHDLYRFFREKLPARVSTFMDELESFAGMQILFGLRVDGVNQMSTRMASEGATILIPTT